MPQRPRSIVAALALALALATTFATPALLGAGAGQDAAKVR